MSIFPKRSIPGQTITIHWNYNTSRLVDNHVCPWVRIGVIDPNGKVTMLFEEHVLALPDELDDKSAEKPKLKYLNKNLPLLVLAEYLEGRHSKEKLVELLQNIQSGRHWYFTYPVPEDAPIGKYTLLSEIHVNGEVRLSKTAADDFFMIEKITLERLNEDQGHKSAVVYNHSVEPTPIKIVGCEWSPERKLSTAVKVFEIPPLQETEIELVATENWLFYNEERQVIPLQSGKSDFILRNQEVVTLEKKQGDTYLLKKENEEAYTLNTEQKALWLKADGLLQKEALSERENDLLNEMIDEDLIQKISY